MEFGISYPARPDAWKDLVVAEENGFTHAWFYDSQMLYSDVYVCMAMAAERTKRIKLATGVAIPSNRIEPVTAHSIATINLLAPGRTILGVGTGFTGRNTMGLPPVPLERLRSYVETVRKLLRGEEVLYREGKRERWIRFLHQDHGYINLKDPIPIHIAADGEKALELAGEIGDGWMTVMADAARFRHKFDAVKKGAARAGRSVAKLPTTMLTTGCVLRDGESITSPRVIGRVGPVAIVMMHSLWEQSAVSAGLQGPLLKLWERYRDDYVANMKTPADRRYLEIHEGHLIYMRPGEEKFIDENLVGMTLTGRGEDIIARLKSLEAEGLKQIAIQVVNDGREMIEEFGREVIAKY
ncbi:MAG: LLM class flavin-dependent oxidoreductase [Candidatus Binatus sp.]|uniref:LLM class flavin-dependent oxidoreductase n=1 Tax=Candidatus Binatus sp. TaxID=2811406 RepID=UPI00271B3B8E|nr:LLM class flavin-dependent oxidoreductase [Candidatus Binatus sp.]MDO8431080.1 LLM class flavin-dependent oxidoreductase [Candidatus Binatus sp.]